ncbi:MAG: hypothetical protein IPJ48_17285 [Propionivibrio sp.]|uniref:Uncharacterized protein n=1 Tax=Candidatus Propionivibrio dominans TaxID=2954373 RepID=A0A9D7FMT7_9RHOO|nr:hypothetical protein [Candidatus Propionivibrio dominans]
MQSPTQKRRKGANGGRVICDGLLQGLQRRATVETRMRRGMVVCDAHVEQLFELRQRDEQGDGYGAALFAKGVVWAASGRACDLTRHAVGERAEEALDKWA